MTESEDYIGPDGLVYCGICHTPKQTRQKFFGQERVFGCMCECESQRKQEERAALEREDVACRLKRRRRDLITNKLLLECTFQAAVETEVIKKCRDYAQALCRGEAGGLGLLLWGGVGSGKTFAAACVANYVIDNGIAAKTTSLPRINGASMEERREFLEAMPSWGLLVLDDLGTERDTATANETTFQVINTRYESRKPMIITTNLTPELLRSPQTQHQARIYDRVLEVCTPVFCGTESMRVKVRQENMERMRGILKDKKETALGATNTESGRVEKGLASQISTSMISKYRRNVK